MKKCFQNKNSSKKTLNIEKIKKNMKIGKPETEIKPETKEKLSAANTENDGWRKFWEKCYKLNA